MRKIIVGSRRSKLALTQTKQFIARLEALNLPYIFEIKEIVTKGDRILDVTLSKVGGKGLFVKEIQTALLSGEIDFAVHSMKDMPSQLPEELTLGCVPVREDARDAFLCREEGVTLHTLPKGAVVGTSSLRRSAQLTKLRDDLEVKWIRGNIDSRIGKMQAGEYDAIILATAGLNRMGWGADVISHYLSLEECVPAVGQGALGIECRADDSELLALLAHVNDEQTRRTTEAERVFLGELNGGCQVPIGGHCVQLENGELQLTGLVAKPDGSIILKETLRGTNPVTLGKEVATALRSHGAVEIIEAYREGALQ